jgi:predicted  nucleic acid-binding Zn-ribbon protein
MSFENLQAEISLLLNQMENQPQDAHELHEQIREKINEMRAFGMPVPEDLLELEKQLEASFKADAADG